MQLTAQDSRFEVRRDVVAHELLDDALRLLHVDLLEYGYSAQTLGQWLWEMQWFPHLRWHDEIVALAETLPQEWRSGTLCDPQILLQFPHVGPEPEIVFHVDDEPPWADGRRYLRIVGIPLTPWRARNGALVVNVVGGASAVEVDPGDAVMLSPDLEHSGGINRAGLPRYAVYFRWLEEG